MSGGSVWFRRIHRSVAILFTATVVANFVVRAQGPGEPSPWVTYAPLLPLALLTLTGLYLFVLPYLSRGKAK